MRLLVLTRYGWKGASSRVRHLNLLEGLRAKGYLCRHHHLISNLSVERFYENRPRPKIEALREYARRLAMLLSRETFDVIWIEKEAFAWLPWSVERIAYGRPDAVTVVDFDDDWPARYSDTRLPLLRGLGRRKFCRSLAAAHGVSASNTVLAETLRAAGPCRPRVIANGLDVEAYRKARERALEAPRVRDEIVVGWIGTPHTAAIHLGPTAGMLNALTAEGQLELLLIGAGSAVPELRAERRGWSETTEPADVADADIGIMPLPEGPFHRGKSGWKLVQFMAAGCPVVASPVGYNRDLVEHGKTGFLAEDDVSFAHHLRLLAGNVEMRQRMGAAARQRVAAQFGLQRAVEETDAFFRELLARQGAGDSAMGPS